jgi:hypothetical protein
MAHWEHRAEPKWKEFRFNQPYEKGLARLRDEVLGKTDFDPATLWQWGTMQAMALIEVLKDSEREFGEAGQALVHGALRRTGFDVGRQILPEGITDAEFVSFYATVINRIAYASLEAPRIDADNKVTFDILWCPHQDHYGAFDCRVQRYFVQGMIEAAVEFAGRFGFEVRFDTTIPSGATTCHFTMWKPDESEKAQWDATTRLLDEKALNRAKRARSDAEGGAT